MSNRTNFLSVNGKKIAYDDTGGNGQLIIAAPGLGDIRQSYRFLTPLLTNNGFRVVTMDLRGTGESDAGWDDYSDRAIAYDIVALINTVGSKQAIIIGNSKSAGAAVIAAADYPTKVEGLVLIGPFAREVPVAKWKILLFKLLLSRPWGRLAWVSYYKSNLYPGNKPSDFDAYVKKLSENLKEPGRFKAVVAQTKDNHAEAGRKLKIVKQKSLVIMGSRDPDFPDPIAEAKYLAKTLNAKLVIAEGSGHYPQADNPEIVANAIFEVFG